MNKTVPTARLCDTEAEKNARKVRKSRIRPIDENTPYDVTGRMFKWAREIRSGALGRVTDVVICARCIGDDGIAYEHFVNGTGSRETYMVMANSVMKRYS